MIHSETIEAVYPLAEILDERKIRVSPLEGTPLKTLVGNSHLPIPSSTSDVEFTIVDRLLQGSRHQGPDGIVGHDVSMDEIADVIGESVRYNLDLARNTVNPIVREVAEELQNHMQTMEGRNQSHIEIRPLTLPSLWNSPTLEQMVERYSEELVMDIKVDSSFRLDTESQPVQKYLHTGAASLDQEIDDFVELMGEDFVLDVFNRYFGYEDNPVIRYTSNVKKWNEMLVVHLFARYFLENPPSDANMTLERFRQYMARVMSQSGRVVVSIMKQRELDRSGRSLVKSWPVDNQRQQVYIDVNGDVYNDFLEKGGSPEVLLGSYVSDRQRSFSYLLDNIEHYEKEWERKLRVLTTGRRLNRFNNALDGLRSAVCRQINEMDEETLPVSKEILHRKLEENLKSLYGHWYETPYEYARVVVCKTLFPHTLALNILCAIDFVAKDQPEIDVREAALLATIEIVTNWVSKLCNIEYMRS